MRNKKKFSILLFSILLILALGTGYYLYHKPGTLNSFLLNNYNKENIEQIEIRSTLSRQDRSIKDKDKITEILANVSNIKLVRHYGSTANKQRVLFIFSFMIKAGLLPRLSYRGKNILILSMTMITQIKSIKSLIIA